MRTLKLKKCKRVRGLLASPDGTQLLALGGVEVEGVETAVWLDLATGEPVRTVRFSAESFLLDPASGRVVLASEIYDESDAPDLVRWLDPWADTVKGKKVEVGTAWTGATSAVAPGALAISPDGKQLMLGYGIQTVRARGRSPEWSHHFAVCPLDPPGPPAVIDLDGDIVSIAIAPDGTRWATSMLVNDRPVLQLHAKLGAAPVASLDVKKAGNPLAYLKFSPDGRYLAGMGGRSIHLFAGDRLAPVRDLGGHPKQLNGYTFSPDGSRVLTACHDGAVRVWDVETGRLLKAFDWGIGPVLTVAFAPDGLTCAAGGDRGQVVVWDVDE